MNKKIRAFFKEIIPKTVVKRIRDEEALLKWYLDGQPVPPPDLIKQKIIRKFGRKNKIKTF